MTIDKQKLRALAKAATPGPWSWWTSNSRLRLTAKNGQDGGVIHAFARSEGPPDVACKVQDIVFIEAANPAAILALLDELDELKRLAILAVNAITAIEPDFRGYENSGGEDIGDEAQYKINALRKVVES